MSNENLKWFMVKSKSSFEVKAKEAIEGAIKKHKKEAFFGQILVPQTEETTIVKGVKKTKKSALFSSYLLVQMVMNNETQTLVRNATHVAGFVGDSKNPVPLSEKEVTQILDQVNGQKKVAPTQIFEVGQLVTITDGPFNTFQGKVNDVHPEKSRVSVLVSVFGRETPVELGFNQVSKTK